MSAHSGPSKLARTKIELTKETVKTLRIKTRVRAGDASLAHTCNCIVTDPTGPG